MTRLHVEYFSQSLQLSTSMTVLLPLPREGVAADPVMPPQGWPTLWLLHGLSDDHTAWTRYTSIERYVRQRGLAVVMPDVHRSYYADMVHGGRFWSLVSEELPRVCRQMFRLSERREDNFVAGLSMGGYGAFKLALNFPQRYAAAASLSGALDPEHLQSVSTGREREWELIFGDPPTIRGTVSDLFHLATQLAERENGPAGGNGAEKIAGAGGVPLYACCGTADFLYEASTRFRDHAMQLGLDLTYEEHEGREHDWGYWDQQIQRVLDWLPIRG